MTLRSTVVVATAATAVSLSAVLMASTPARAEHLTMTTKSPNEVKIRGYARFDSNCAANEAPEIYLDVPPQNGFVCVRASRVTVRRIYAGTAGCVGRSMSGLDVIYLPRRTFSGVEAIRYTVKFPTVTVTIDADIKVQSDQAGTEGGRIPAFESLQTQGPVPVCVPLVS
jgi:hypothetical protein